MVVVGPVGGNVLHRVEMEGELSGRGMSAGGICPRGKCHTLGWYTSRLVKDKSNMCVSADAEVVVHDVERQTTGRHATHVVDRRQVAVNPATVTRRRQRTHRQVPPAHE